ASLDEISLRHHISEESLQKLIQKCLMRHEDGTPWGFRALLPRVNVVDHTPTEEVAAPSGEAEDEVVSYVSIAEPEQPPHPAWVGADLSPHTADLSASRAVESQFIGSSHGVPDDEPFI